MASRNTNQKGVDSSMRDITGILPGHYRAPYLTPEIRELWAYCEKHNISIPLIHSEEEIEHLILIDKPFKD